MVFLYILVWLINTLFLFFHKKSKCLTVLSALFLVFLYFWSTGSGDYEANFYEYTYHVYSNQVEIGYNTIIKIANNFSLSFNQFQGIVCSCCLLITLYVFGRFSKNYQLFFSIYLIYQCLYDMDTLKNFIGRALLFVAIMHLLRHHKFKYFLFVILAFFFHRVFILYLPLGLINYRKVTKSKIKKWIIFISMLLVFFYLLSLVPNFFLFFTKLIPFERLSDKMVSYFRTSSRITFVVYIVLHLLNIIYLLNHRSIFRQNKKYRHLYSVFLVFNLYVMISFPFLIIGNVFFRIFNNIYLLNFIMYAITLDNVNKNRYLKSVVGILAINGLYRLPFVHSSAEFSRVFYQVKK